MRENLATLIQDFRNYSREIAVVRYQGNRRRVSSYGDIARLAGRFASLLNQKNIGIGDRVILWGENSAEWIAAFHGCVLRGILVVPLDAYGTVDFANRVASDVKPKLAVGDLHLLRQLRTEPVADFPRVAFDEWLGQLPPEQAGPVKGLNRDTPLQILFTSGTTGDPKGIVHTHGNVLASVGPIEQASQRYLRYEKYVHPLRFLHTLPLSHVFGQTMGLWIPPIFRAELHLESRLVAPRIIETIHRERISVLAAVPRVFAVLKTYLETSDPELAGRLAASKGIPAWKRWWRFRAVHRVFGLKFWALISGGGALAEPVENFWNGLGFVVVQGYGMTETAALITLNHPFHVARGTIGKPLPGREIKIGPDGEVLVRGPMISTATWAAGQLRQRQGEWLSTGDLAETQPTGELRFLGRKSEVIVTGTGVNIHPEDLEAVIEEQPGVTACAVVPIETPSGPEACAVLAMRGPAEWAPVAIENANLRLAEFQRVRRWRVWPEPDLPRTSTGKVRRKAVASWLANTQVNRNDSQPTHAAVADSDWLLALIKEISGEAPPGTADELRLAEDLHLDSLGRVQLSAAIEEKLGMPPESGLVDEVQTLGQLRHLITGTEAGVEVPHVMSRDAAPRIEPSIGIAPPEVPGVSKESVESVTHQTAPQSAVPNTAPRQRRYVYPHWPWLAPVQWTRSAFIELMMLPLVRFLAKPRVMARLDLADLLREPVLIIANHVTTYDGPLVQYALPGRVRRRLAVAMSGEMLDDFRHFRDPERSSNNPRSYPIGPIAYLLVTALFNVFPLPRLRDFQRSFAHAGEALDRGYHVLVFPEGSRSAEGKLARFRPGIGLLVKQSGTAVLPIGIRGLGELKVRGRGWFRSGRIEIHVGEPIRFSSEASETAIAECLYQEVEQLLAQQ